MTLRKPVGSGERSQIAGAIPDTLNLSSSSQPSTKQASAGTLGESTIPHLLKDHYGNEDIYTRGNETASLDAQDDSDVVSDVHNRGRRMSGNYSSTTSGLPPSLQIAQPIETPRSSLEDTQLDETTSSQLQQTNEWEGHPPAPERSRSRSTSSNPFRRGVEKVPLDTRLTKEAAGFNVWADEANDKHIGSENRADQSAYTPYPYSANSTHEYSPVCATPFDEPYMISPGSTNVLPSQQLHPPVKVSGTKELLSSAHVSQDTVPGQSYAAEPVSDSVPYYPPPVPSQSLQGTETSRQESGVVDVKSGKETVINDVDKTLPPLPSRLEEPRPPLPPRGDEPRPPLPARSNTRQGPDASARSLLSRVETSVDNTDGTQAQAQTVPNPGSSKSQTSETYQIRLINWYDASSNINPRRSPIMVQNANGPCPLLALVNALCLSTPAGLSTALVNTLERREQVSLGLLLDVVIDELMSGRRGDAAQNLPDVSELYAFLLNLHTGMNVNPRFNLPPSKQPNLMDAPIEENLRENSSSTRFAGAFEDTKEMKLYSTFAVPLIHGWIPSRTHPAFAALERSAKTYEDAQNLLFAEEELENKLQKEGLTQKEQLLLEDIGSIKYFLSSSATQLTGYGLDSITESLYPGQTVILFRNDHFSTLYRHPRSGQLFSLVTDMGYAGHDEVVWESLVDVSGEGSEFFSGDFRAVGNNHSAASPSASSTGDGWTTVTRSQGGGRPHSRLSSQGGTGASSTGKGSAIGGFSSLSIRDNDSNPKSPSTEQEDHDLALALQLQEEEEERERQEIAARKREDELSQAFLESRPPARGRGSAKKGPEPHPTTPARNSARLGSMRDSRSNPTGLSSWSTPRRPQTAAQDEADDAPPPSYEQAAKGPAYHPPAGHPSLANASPSSVRNTSRPQGRLKRSSAFSENSAALAGSPMTSNPNGSQYTQTPTPSAQSQRRSARGGFGVGGAAPGVYRRDGTPGVTPTEADRNKGDCITM